MMNTMHLFAGAGGGLLADLLLGHNPICAVEWEKFPADVLKQRAKEGWFPNLEVYHGDVREFNGANYKGRVDCIHAGFPCQDLSVSGAQKGIGEGTRSGLYREVLRIADECRPRYLFLENVTNILGSGLETVLFDLAQRGYDAEWMCLSASYCGAVHRRDRWWLLAVGNTDKDGFNGRLHSEEEARVSERSTKEPTPRISSSNRVENKLPTPRVFRRTNDVANGLDRIAAIGNGQVPLVAATAFRILMSRLQSDS